MNLSGNRLMEFGPRKQGLKTKRGSSTRGTSGSLVIRSSREVVAVLVTPGSVQPVNRQ